MRSRISSWCAPLAGSRRIGSAFAASTRGSWSRNRRMCGVSPEASFSKALSTSTRNGVPASPIRSVRLKYKAHNSDRVNPAARALNAWPSMHQRVRPSSLDRSSKRGNPASSSAWRSRRMVRVVTLQSAANSPIVTPAPRDLSISLRTVHWRTTSVFLGTLRIVQLPFPG